MITEKIGKLIEFNPSEALFVGSVAKKIAMEKLVVGERKIKGYDYGVFSSGAKFRNGDTLLAKITPCLENGKTALVDILEDDEIAFGSTEFIVLRETEFIDKDYLFYLARSPHFRQLAISSMEGTSGRKRVAESALQSREITIPKDKKEQQKIANILSSLDEKIELNNKIISELEQMAKELYDYWFVQFDFPDANGKPYRSSGGKITYNPTLKREIPDDWGVKAIEKIEPKIITGKTPSTAISDNFNGDIPFITIDDIRGNVFIGNTKRTLTIQGAETQKTKYLPKGTLCVSCIGTVGVMGYTSVVAQTNQQINSIIFTDEKNKYFLFFALQHYFHSAKAKVGNIFSNMSKEEFAGILILYPDRYILKEYYNQMSNTFDNIHILHKERLELAALRDWLLSMLMNGQVTVQTDTKVEIEKETPIINLSQQRNQQFELWLSNQGVAARGEIDKATLREIFDAMDEDDK